MATETPAASANNEGSASASEGQESQGQQTPTSASEGQEQQQSSTPEQQAPVTLPDDHPLVLRLKKLKESEAAHRQELTELRATSAKVTQLQGELDKRPTAEALSTLQTRYDRLEAFLQESQSSLSKALDSRTFTRRLFETEDDIQDILKDWNKANPTATSVALGSAPAAPSSTSPNMNDILRSAIRK